MHAAVVAVVVVGGLPRTSAAQDRAFKPHRVWREGGEAALTTLFLFFYLSPPPLFTNREACFSPSP